jgi:hypothetical protein
MAISYGHWVSVEGRSRLAWLFAVALLPFGNKPAQREFYDLVF